MKYAVLTTAAMGLAIGLVRPAHAVPVTFTVDPTRSSAALTAAVTVFGSPLTVTRQSGTADSWLTSYSGTIVADVTGSTIQFLSPSRIIANQDNAWRPGTDFSNYPGDIASPTGYTNTAMPAAYGSITDLTPIGPLIGVTGQSPSAIRNLQLSLTDAAPKALVGGAFDESGTATDLVWDTPTPPALIYYSSGASPPVTRADTVEPTATLVSAQSGTLETVNGVLTLTIPVVWEINFPVNFLFLTNRFEGTIVATAVPEPTTMTTGIVLAAALCLRRRRA